MLTIILCLLGLILLVLATDILGKVGMVGPELKRKIFHICSGTFIAFWPWLMSWTAIELLGLAMAAIVILNYRLKIFDFYKGIGRRSYGDLFMALGISLAALTAPTKVVFALALLNVSLADSSAALIGKKYGKNWRYRIFSQEKSVIGTMTFWLVSLCVSAICLIFARDQMQFSNYVELIIIMPPILAALENFSLLGLDNLTVPLAAIALVNLLT
ncbi:MAG TPA: hypothetical protein VG964_03970 [Candidatus Saccharimonadales bacterium]|nr:hypothetical protein [Candidatus Saccharimonadales bacterium]